ncbi:MAG TPA: hypothetical protein DCZ92_07580 [Elusimicrobia bacterium]|nr:MAG: hypothetical protein A2016_10515 [Elusimicrobia bacterium GWF2_62_30]HBA60667.1 hypothetical protein [Elusimicrobiota bacterium]
MLREFPALKGLPVGLKEKILASDEALLKNGEQAYRYKSIIRADERDFRNFSVGNIRSLICSNFQAVAGPITLDKY